MINERLVEAAHSNRTDVDFAIPGQVSEYPAYDVNDMASLLRQHYRSKGFEAELSTGAATVTISVLFGHVDPEAPVRPLYNSFYDEIARRR
jgi:hypothetical protein